MRMSFGDRIREKRQALGMTQDDLARAAGCKTMQVSRWERGEVAYPDADLLVPLADALRTTTDYLLRSEADMPHGLAEAVANYSEIFQRQLTDAEIAWCRAEVRSHGDVPASEWYKRIEAKRRGLTPASRVAVGDRQAHLRGSPGRVGRCVRAIG